MTSYSDLSSLSEHITYHEINYYPYNYVILTFLIKLKPISSMSHFLQATYAHTHPIHQENRKENPGDSPLAFLAERPDIFRLFLKFWREPQKHHLQKINSRGTNLIRLPKRVNIWILYEMAEQKIIVLTNAVVFHWPLPVFLIIRFFAQCMHVQKEVHETDFFCGLRRYVQIILPPWLYLTFISLGCLLCI